MSSSVNVDFLRDEDGGPVLSVEGDLDLCTSIVLEEALRSLWEEGHSRVSVDLSGSGCVDSSGIRVLLEVSRDLRDRGGRLVMTGCPRRVARTFRMLGVGELLEGSR